MAHKKSKKETTFSPPIYDNFYFEPKTQTQAEACIDYADGKNLILSGYAGTGKTFIALCLALQELIAGNKKKIRLIRSAQATRDIGFLPGSEEEKLEAFERAFSPLINKLLRRGDAYQILKDKRIIEFNSTSYLRGLTFDDEIIIIDETQNLTVSEIDCIITRTGKNTNLIFCGDEFQSDMPRGSGLSFLKSVAAQLENYFSTFEFQAEDIVRSGLVKSYILARADAHLR